MDQCKYCHLRGDMVKCYQVDCTIHESWYVQELTTHINELNKQLKNTSSNIASGKCIRCKKNNSSRLCEKSIAEIRRFV